MVKADYVALQFLPQADYAQLAILEIEPRPDVVTRISLLFGTLRHIDDEWTVALDRSISWPKVVGIDRVSALDSSLF